jgi:GT2 family glycosyltransferase
LLLSIIIVNYKSAQLISDCLQSARRFESFNNFEWIIVDNQSNDNSKLIITAEFPNVIWIDMGYNAGFSRANNEGMRIAKGEVFLLLNPDTIILEDAINKCLHKFIPSNHIACGVQIFNKDLSNQISGSYFMKGGLNHLLPLPYYGFILKQLSSLFNIKKPSIEKASREQFVDWISGAYLMVKKKIVKQTGLMDEDFFLYAEEIEWCSRLASSGTLCIYGDLHIIHLVGETITASTNSNDKSYTNLFDKKGGQLILSNHLRIRKQYGILWFLFQLLNYTLATLLFFICSFTNHLFHFENPFKDFNKAIGLARNVKLVWAHLYIIILNKPHFYKVL